MYDIKRCMAAYNISTTLFIHVSGCIKDNIFYKLCCQEHGGRMFWIMLLHSYTHCDIAIVVSSECFLLQTVCSLWAFEMCVSCRDSTIVYARVQNRKYFAL